MTTTPNVLVATFNHESSLLLATEDDHEAWLNGSAEEVLEIVKPLLPERVRIVQKGHDKRNRLDVGATT
jgi:putative SOS response-associated peptidase YedK